MGTVKIALRTETVNKDGESPIRLTYSLKGNRQHYSTGLKARKENWDEVNQEAGYINKPTAKKLLPEVEFNLLPSSNDIQVINSKLSKLRQDIQDIEKLFELSGKSYSKEMVIEELKGKQMETTKVEGSPQELYSYIDQYIEKHKVIRKKGSLSVYKSI